jgi:hypothetical protein
MEVLGLAAEVLLFVVKPLWVLWHVGKWTMKKINGNDLPEVFTIEDTKRFDVEYTSKMGKN